MTTGVLENDQLGSGPYTPIAFAGYRSRVRRGADPFPCHHARDMRADALLSFIGSQEIRPEPGAREAHPSQLRLAVVEITKVSALDPGGFQSGPGTCEVGGVCPRNLPPSSCRFMLSSVFERPQTRLTYTDRTIDWEGAVSRIATRVVRPGARNFALVSGVTNFNGGTWDVTEIVRENLRTRRESRFVLSIADEEPSLLPEHRMKNIRCDAYFETRLRVIFAD